MLKIRMIKTRVKKKKCNLWNNENLKILDYYEGWNVTTVKYLKMIKNKNLLN